MNVIIDTNIVFAALIKDSFTREVLFSQKIQLFSPTFLFIEIEKYQLILQKEKNISPEKFEQIKEILMDYITIIDEEKLKPFLARAKQLSPDPNDVPYFAAALYLNCPIWSNDKKLKTQSVVRIISTTDILKDTY